MVGGRGGRRCDRHAGALPGAGAVRGSGHRRTGGTGQRPLAVGLAPGQRLRPADPAAHDPRERRDRRARGPAQADGPVAAGLAGAAAAHGARAHAAAAVRGVLEDETAIGESATEQVASTAARVRRLTVLAIRSDHVSGSATGPSSRAARASRWPGARTRPARSSATTVGSGLLALVLVL